MLGTLYHARPRLSTVVSGGAKAYILVLAETARAYGCEHIVTPHIEYCLYRQREHVSCSCASNSVKMLEIAVSIESDWIFKEAAINLIGQGHWVYTAAQLMLEELGVQGLFVRKRAEFIQNLRNCELEMLTCIPIDVQGTDQFARGLFREWLSQRLTRGEGSRLELVPGEGFGTETKYAKVYRDISRGDLYNLNHDKLIHTLLGPMRRAEPDVKAVFKWASGVIKPIMKDFSCIQHNKGLLMGIRPLTFINIGNEELPWIENPRDLTTQELRDCELYS